MICTNCSSQMPEGQKFCAHCGAELQSAEHSTQPSQAEASNADQKTPKPAQVAATTMQKAAVPQFTTQTHNDSVNPNNSQKHHKRNKKMVAITALVLVLFISGVGATTYFTNGFGLLGGENKSKQGISTTSDSGNSSSPETKKTEKKKDADEKPSVKVSNISFDTVKVAKTYEENPNDAYAIKGVIENSTDQYVLASPSFIFKISYTDKYGNKKNSDAILKSNLEVPDEIQLPGPEENKGIFLAPHEKKEFTYYINDFTSYENPNEQNIPNARFQIVGVKSSDNILKLSPAEGTVTVDSVELEGKACSFTPIVRLKALTPNDANLSLSYSFDSYEASVIGTITNTTEDKWRTARIYYRTERDGYYLLGSHRQYQNVNFLKPDVSEKFKENAPYVTASTTHTYEIKPTAITYEVDNIG